MGAHTGSGPAADGQDELAEPNHGFDDSRRLTGANRWFGGTAVTLTPLGPAATSAPALADWSARVRVLCGALGWPDPAPIAVHAGQQTTLVFAAPEGLLYTATEVNEWAWERAAAAAGTTGFDLAQDLGDDITAASAIFADRAAAEHRPALAALRSAAEAQGLPLLVDDETLSLGAGSGSRCWPLDALPDLGDVPWDALHDVPTALVTGSNGKTTTVRLIAAMARAAGYRTGYCSTEGVVIGQQSVAPGDYAGPAGARCVLRHPEVDLAVLETARGGLLRRGLAVPRADVAVVTNISADHLGEYGIGSAAELAEVKLAVAHALGAGGHLVLNAEDATLRAAAARLPHAAAARHSLFARDHEHPALVALRAASAASAKNPGHGPPQLDGSTCGVQAGRLLLWQGGRTHDLGPVAAMPITLGGQAQHNIENAAAAALAATALGLAPGVIADTLKTFGSRPEDNPGRLEHWSLNGATVLLDYAHNPDGLARLLHLARGLQPRRLVLLLGQAGNRDDAAIAELARTAAAFAPDRVLIKELPLMLRGRAPGEVPALLLRTLQDAGLPADRIAMQADEETAALELLGASQAGDVIVLPIHTTGVRERLTQWLADMGQR